MWMLDLHRIMVDLALAMSSTVAVGKRNLENFAKTVTNLFRAYPKTLLGLSRGEYR